MLCAIVFFSLVWSIDQLHSCFYLCDHADLFLPNMKTGGGAGRNAAGTCFACLKTELDDPWASFHGQI